MSISCQKDYQIRVNPPTPPPILYYKFESLGAGGVLDSADGYNIALVDIFSAMLPGWLGWTVQPGLIGNCFQTTLNTGVFAQINPCPFNIGGARSITVRFWLRYTKSDDFVYWEVNTPYFGCRIVGSTAAPTTVKFRCYLAMATTPIQFGDISIACTANAWHRAVFQFDQPNGRLGMQLDNGAMQTQQITIPAPPFNNNYTAGDEPFYIIHASPNGAGENSRLDELGIWNELLTADQLLDDWNGGAGRTYP